MIKDIISIKDVKSGDIVYCIGKYSNVINEYNYRYSYKHLMKSDNIVVSSKVGVHYDMHIKNTFKTREDAELELIKRKI